MTEDKYDLSDGIVDLSDEISEELAVITGSRRQATVSTKTNVELLCISAWDFEDIFMAGGIKTLTDPDHDSFLRSVSFLKHWPIQELAEHPQACMYHYFNRGQVLVRDSNNSDWIYIVKSKLHHVKAKTSGKSENVHDEDNPTHDSRTFGTWRHRLPRHASRGKRDMRRSCSPEVFRNQVEADRRLEQSLPGLNNASERLGSVDYDRVITDYRARVLPKPTSNSLRLPKLPVRGLVSAPEQSLEPLEGAGCGDTSLPAEISKDDQKSKVEANGEEDSSEDLEEHRPIRKTSKGVYLAASPSRRRKKSTRRVQTYQASDSRDPNLLFVTDYQRRFRERVGRKTMAEALDFKGARDFRYSEVDLDPMFVLVQILERGQYFGVSQILYPDQPSTCLVSNGAECIVLSKKLFLERECPFPGEEVLQSRLQDYVNWEAHRARVYRRLVTDIRQRQARRKQFLPHIPGTYCFRSGSL
ncbi:hypothetical protein BaRGS_00000903 [Batillaria attramentaria]|uniref:Cyclic nucleotide-binding domain-containing protein n=1 Tax=Batillaria attramentaria TaxID=370345 RepID=A0ABD0M7Z6_9CAEN